MLDEDPDAPWRGGGDWGSAFDAGFAKLLWPVVHIFVTEDISLI